MDGRMMRGKEMNVDYIINKVLYFALICSLTVLGLLASVLLVHSLFMVFMDSETDCAPILQANATTPAFVATKPHQPPAPTVIYYYNNSYYNYTTQRCDTDIQFPLRREVKCSRHAKLMGLHGQSMHPFSAGGKIWMDPKVKWDDLQPGDIVLMDVNGTNITHALTYKGDYYALSAGYNNDYVDAWHVHPNMVKMRYCIK